MAIESVPINTGTAAQIMCDQSGTQYAQVVKIVQGADGVFDTLSSALLVTATGVTVASVTTGTFTVAGTPVVTASQGGTWNIATVSTLLGTVAISGTVTNAVTVGTITTVLGTVAVSGGGGGVQYSINDTSMAATGTGTLILGMQSGATTARGIAVTTTGAQHVSIVGTPAVTAANVTIASVTTGTMSVINVLSASGVTIASVATGTVNVVNTPTVTVSNPAQQYAVDTTAMAATATGTLILGMQSGATTARGIAITTTGAQHVSIIGTPAVTAANVTIASVTTGTVSVVNVLSASGVTVASLTTGTVSIAAIAAGTNNVGSFVGTAHASRWNAYAVNTTSGASVIVKTSGAHTLYITDMIVSVDVPSRVDIYSAATTQMSLYLATKGGLAVGLSTPLVLNSNQSLTFTPSVSGSSMVYAAGYTVT